MNIVVLSGKGGTGKTFVSTNLAKIMNANYIDCDVEEPNGYIFLKPKDVIERDVLCEVPKIDDDNCVNCFKCVDFCEFNALASLQDEIKVFGGLCHSCGGCQIVCDYDSIEYVNRRVGVIKEGNIEGNLFKSGLLDIGEPMAVPIIKELLKDLDKDKINIIDSAPGTSCNVVNTLEYADYAIMVTEPTRFGLHDLDRAVKLAKEMNIKFGIVINRMMENQNIIIDYCKEQKLNIIGCINYDKEIALRYAKGELISDIKSYKEIFKQIGKVIEECCECK